LPFLVFLRIKKQEQKINPVESLKMNQSRMVVLMNDISLLRSLLTENKEISTQATEFFDKKNTRMIVLDETAYWISQNALYSADFVDGEVDLETKKTVDTFALNKIQLEKMSNIVEALTEGYKGEDRDTGNK